MHDTDADLDRIEAEFPRNAWRAFRAAHLATLQAALPIVSVVGGMLVKIFPDGQRIELKKVEPGIRVEVGHRIRIE